MIKNTVFTLSVAADTCLNMSTSILCSQISPLLFISFQWAVLKLCLDDNEILMRHTYEEGTSQLLICTCTQHKNKIPAATFCFVFL